MTKKSRRHLFIPDILLSIAPMGPVLIVWKLFVEVVVNSNLSFSPFFLPGILGAEAGGFSS
jgi:hypothetical protein